MKKLEQVGAMKPCNKSSKTRVANAALLERVAVARTCFIALMISGGAMLSACASHPVEETVTTSASRSAQIPASGAPPIAIVPNLPARDADIEKAGDHIAEAITHLGKSRRGGHEAALRALGQAEAAMNRALRAKARDERASHALHAALRDVQNAERTVQRGAASDTLAARQLAALNKDLDDLTMQPQTPHDAAEAPPDDQSQLP